MPIIVSEPFGSKGKTDAKRHRNKQREAIKKHLPEIISQESIITRKNGRTTKIPIKSIEIPVFKPKRDGQGSGGLGQGKGGVGDIIGQRSGNGQGEPGQEPGEDYIETEVDIEEIIEMMLEDLGLPKLEEKEVENIIIELGFKIRGITDSGPWVLLDRRRTGQEGLKRFYSYLSFLQTETGLDELTCFRALKQAGGIVNDALEIIKTGKITVEAEKVEPLILPTNDDLRFRKIEEDTESRSRAVIIAMRDVSGSMGEMKRYFSRSMLFWLVRFLEKIYKQVEVRFITHHAVARVVDEETFFHAGEDGGTLCYTAYEKARELIEAEYPPDKWNVYCWHFSDGEDSGVDRTLEELGRLIGKGINMFGYGQVQPEEESSGWSNIGSTLWQKFLHHFPLKEEHVKDMPVIYGENDFPFLGVIIAEKEDIWPALQAFLKKDRWAK